MTYEEYKAIAELVDIYLRYWSTAANLKYLTEEKEELINVVKTAYAVITSNIIKMIPIVEKYPEYKKKYMEEAGFVTTPNWAAEIIKGCEK